MSDQDQIPAVETQVTETPLQTVVPEGAETEPETPAESNSEQQKEPAATHKKTPEQVNKDRAHFQREAQRVKEQLAALSGEPEKADERPLEQQYPVVDRRDQRRDLTKDELNEFLRENPAELGVALAEYLSHTVKSELSEFRKNQEVAAQNREANRILREFCSRNDISNDELNAAASYVKQIGIKGSPAGMSSLIIDRVITNRVLGNINQTVTEAAARASAAVKAQTLTTQPAGHVPEEKPKTITAEEIISSKYGPSDKTQKLNRLKEKFASGG